MTTVVTIPAQMSTDGSVHVYSDDSDPITGLDGGGHVYRLVPLFADAVSLANHVASLASSVANSPSTSSTSSTSLTIGLGSKTLTLNELTKTYFVGQTINISDSTGTNVMVGQVTAFTQATGSLTVNVRAVIGSGTISAWTISLSGFMAGNLIFPQEITNVGYLEVPQKIITADYTLILTDSGKQIYHPSTDAVARTVTIPTNTTTAFPIGTGVTIINETSQQLTVTTADTLVMAGSGTTGNRSIAQYGVATILKVGATRWFISGNGVI